MLDYPQSKRLWRNATPVALSQEGGVRAVIDRAARGLHLGRRFRMLCPAQALPLPPALTATLPECRSRQGAISLGYPSTEKAPGRPRLGGRAHDRVRARLNGEGRMARNTRGFTIIEMIVMMLLLAVAASIALPRALKSSPQQQVDLAARTLTRDLEQLRMKAIASKRSIRVRFYTGSQFYSAFMDITPERLETIAETSDEVRESGLFTRGSAEGVSGVPLPTGVVFGVGSATTGPAGYPVADPVALTDDYVEFDSRGMVKPAGSAGVVFISHQEDPRAVAAVTITGASAFRTWRFRGGSWIH